MYLFIYGVINIIIYGVTALRDDTIIDHFCYNHHRNNWLADDFMMA